MKRTCLKAIAVSALISTAFLAGCATGRDEMSQNANYTVQRLSVGPHGEYDTKTIPHSLDHGGNGTFNETASQYRWIRAQAITKVDHNSFIFTIARVPDNIPQLHYGDVIDVLFLAPPNENFDELKTAVVLRLVCTDNACRRKLYKEAGNSNYLGPTNEPVPDISGLKFSKFYDTDGKILPGRQLPQ